MKTLHFSTLIDAPKQTVWKVLWEDETYRKWSSAFMEGSYAVSDWKEGSKIQFLSPSGEGMFSMIDKLEPNRFMSFKHLGMMKDGKELPVTDEVKEWVGAKENYTLTDKGNATELTVDLDITEAYENEFTKMFPNALDKVKKLSESEV